MISTVPLKSMFRNQLKQTQWYLMYIFSRLNRTRNLAISLYSLRKTKKAEEVANNLSCENSLFPQLNVNEAIRNLHEDGFFPGIQLPHNVVENILTYIQPIECIPYHDGPRDPNTGMSLLADGPYKKRYSRSRYENTFQNSPDIQAIINDPKLLMIATEYLQNTPIYMGSRLWWSHAGAPPYDLNHAGQAFHYDIDDYQALRFFFYLTDVDESSSPHVVIRGSHNRKRLSDKIATTRFRTDHDLIDFYGQSAVVNLCGKAGFGFAEEPRIFHKGIVPKHHDRLILLVRYSMNKFAKRN